MFEQPIKDCITQYEIEGILCEFDIEKPGEYIGHPDLLVMMRHNGVLVKALCDIKTYGLYKVIL